MWFFSTTVLARNLVLQRERITDTYPLNENFKDELLDLIEYNQDERYDEPVFKSKEGVAVNHDSFNDRFQGDIEAWGGRQNSVS
jgi:hypothetical protein